MQVKERNADARVPRSVSMPPAHQAAKTKQFQKDSFFHQDDSSEEEHEANHGATMQLQQNRQDLAGNVSLASLTDAGTQGVEGRVRREVPGTTARH